ncbi:DUF2690 domain-containing protein [Actinophytocola oryzae]|uniref:Uncharacterized protein DUF2690 n=1 Tax=Actinophytocola oryzae TaxID=502181 RepID=A0A4R7W602_9PSEU|nr:DUF2690 domain-containing protein [Actinophytocola oryzae]TDV57429.1 uncharacterized protein DUF2690 [Actinophytocola oryzae]
MRILRRTGTAIASAILVIAGSTLTASPAYAADYDCPGGSNPNALPGTATTPVSPVHIGGRAIELRYNRTARCAWGRITLGAPGDKIWVDWSRTLTGDHAPWAQLGVTQIATGTSKFTNAYNDAGYVMRACGQPVGYGLVCTGWY